MLNFARAPLIEFDAGVNWIWAIDTPDDGSSHTIHLLMLTSYLPALKFTIMYPAIVAPFASILWRVDDGEPLVTRNLAANGIMTVAAGASTNPLRPVVGSTVTNNLPIQGYYAKHDVTANRGFEFPAAQPAPATYWIDANSNGGTVQGAFDYNNESDERWRNVIVKEDEYTAAMQQADDQILGATLNGVADPTVMRIVGLWRLVTV